MSNKKPSKGNTNLENKQNNGNNGQNTEQKKKIKIRKYNLTAMDYVTIGFTALIVLIMIFILLRTIRPDWFRFSGKEASASSSLTSPTASPTGEPTLFGTGNEYGNMTNSPYMREIDGRLYFTAAGENQIPYIYVTVDGETRPLLQANAFCLNVIRDPFTYAKDEAAHAYTVFYIDADGNICYFTDGPVYENRPFSNETAKAGKVMEGDYSEIAVRDQYLFFIDGDGHIGKISLLDNQYTVLSIETYSKLAVYGSTIYALNATDGSLYVLATTERPAATAAPTEDPSATGSAENASPSPTETPIPGVDEYEIQILEESADHFCIDGSWIYTVSDKGVIRYSGDGSGKDTLSSRKADYINVLGGQIFIIDGGTLYVGTAAQYLLGQETALGTVSTKDGINLTKGAVYVYDNTAHTLMVSKVDSETGAYGALTAVVLP